MSSRHLPTIALLAALLFALGFWLHRARREPALVAIPPSAATALLAAKNENLKSPIPVAAPASVAALAPALPLPPRSPRPAPSENSADPVSAALDLNSPRTDITRDLILLNDVFTNWRLDFHGAPHPFGENSDITAALTGDNPLRLALIPRTHPAINPAGELCDRWGTPFRFHALAGDRMELRSAGPDKKFGTADDALLTPP